MRVHVENHSVTRGTIFRNIILGGQDGVVNILGIVLGVATATNSNSLVLITGLAATFAESISMAAVAYTSTKAQAEHYHSEVKRELDEMEKIPEMEREEIVKIYRDKGFSGPLLGQVVDKICSNKKVWLDTMMREELRLENPSETISPFWQSILVGSSAIIGSLIPIIPFFFFPVSPSILYALVASSMVLFFAGACKSHLTSGEWLRGGLEMMIIGAIAAVIGYLIGVLLST
jgi:VIT1/CCC1 family predicted Fe2+/Mn2+ transporter